MMPIGQQNYSTHTKTYTDIQPLHSPDFICRALASTIGGVILGIIVSLIINCTLLEISLNVFFATYFGLLFIIVGAIILWRVKQQSERVSVGYGVQPEPHSEERRRQLTLFGCLILVSGFMCFLLEDPHWWFKLTTLTKVPFYSILGVSVSFALTFSVIDMVNYCVGCCQGNNLARPLVESQNQIYLILCVAFVMGGIFGCIFGFMDVPDQTLYRTRLLLLKAEHTCYQIGAVLGGIAGFGNEYLRAIEVSYSPVSLEFDDDI